MSRGPLQAAPPAEGQTALACDDDPENGVWYYRGRGSVSVPRQQAPAVDYFCGNSFVTGWLLYTSGDVAFVQFRTVDWQGYDGYSNYTVTAIFRGHLRPVEERPPGAKRLDRAQRDPAVLPNISHHQGNGQREPPPPRVAKPLPESSRASNGEIPHAAKKRTGEYSTDTHRSEDKLPTAAGGRTLKEIRSRKSADSEILGKYGPGPEIRGFCLKDFLGRDRRA